MVFEKRTTKKFEEVKSILDNITNSDKYQGFWEGNILFISKRVGFSNKITSDIQVEIRNGQSERIVLVSCELRNRFQKSIKALIFILTVFEIIIIYAIFKNRTFNILVFIPILLIFFSYFIFYLSYKFECDDFRYELNKILNRA